MGNDSHFYHLLNNINILLYSLYHLCFHYLTTILTTNITNSFKTAYSFLPFYFLNFYYSFSLHSFFTSFLNLNKKLTNKDFTLFTLWYVTLLIPTLIYSTNKRKRSTHTTTTLTKMTWNSCATTCTNSNFYAFLNSHTMTTSLLYPITFTLFLIYLNFTLLSRLSSKHISSSMTLLLSSLFSHLTFYTLFTPYFLTSHLQKLTRYKIRDTTLL